MMRTAVLSLALVSTIASAQDLAVYNKGLAAYNSGSFEAAALQFYQVYNTTSDNDLRVKSEYYLASAFQRQALPFTAFVYFAPIVKAGPQHPFHLKSVEALVTIQDVLQDDYLIPSLLNNLYDKFADDWTRLPPEVLSRINYLIGRISHRRSKLDDAKQFLEAVPENSQIYAKAQYLLGITLADPRYPASNENERRKHAEEAANVFIKIGKMTSAKQKDLVETQQLSALALGRVNYNIEQFSKSVQAYETIPRFSKYWDQALFENGFARFQNEDMGGALGSLQALHAPQFTGAFQPESWILKATVYYFSCLYEESRAALNEFESIYLPIQDKLRPFVEGEPKDLNTYFKLVDSSETDKIPQSVLNWVRSNDRMLGVFGMLKQIDTEKQVINENQAWKAAKLSSELTTYLDQNRGTLEQVAGNFAKGRLADSFRQIKGFSDQAEIIRFEISKAEKEIAETGMDPNKYLRAQTLYRPGMPAEHWNYWKFEGEFWRDEIGYYQYTLKKGCPSN